MLIKITTTEFRSTNTVLTRKNRIAVVSLFYLDDIRSEPYNGHFSSAIYITSFVITRTSSKQQDPTTLLMSSDSTKAANGVLRDRF